MNIQIYIKLIIKLHTDPLKQMQCRVKKGPIHVNTVHCVTVYIIYSYIYSKLIFQVTVKT